METDDRRKSKSRQWIETPLSDAVIRHLDWASFDTKRKEAALDALRTEQPNLYDAFMLRDEVQEDAGRILGITQSAVSKRLKDACRFLAEYLLACELGAPTTPSIASVAKMLGFSRKRLVRELVSDLEPYEIQEALDSRLPRHAKQTATPGKDEPA
jgi:hypothetical protein